MGAKNLKAIVIVGDESFDLPAGKEYAQLFQKIYGQLTETSMMDKYHNLGTPINVAVLNGIKALPCRNLQRTSDEAISGITGETFADRTLLRNTACAGCPVGCIHLGFVREKFSEPNQYLYRQVTYDHEPIFAMGAMLSVLDAFQVLTLLEIAEKEGLDVMSAGVALAWATEAFEKGLISEKETLIPLKFGDAGAYAQAVKHLGQGPTIFTGCWARGRSRRRNSTGGRTSPASSARRWRGMRPARSSSSPRRWGFAIPTWTPEGTRTIRSRKGTDCAQSGPAVEFLVQDEKARVFLTSMVSCLFAREVYKEAVLADCLNAVGYRNLAENVDSVAQRVQKHALANADENRV